MINHKDKIETEGRVLIAARDIFQRKGFAGARMDDIARSAGVNKALLHYYFRSKEKLFERIFQEAVGQFISKVIKILNGDLPLDVKIYRTVDIYSNMLSKNRHLPFFVLGEVKENPDFLAEMIKPSGGKIFSNLGRQLEEGYREGKIIKISVEEFFVNLISLTVFPFLAKPLMDRVFELEEEDFIRMIHSRRKTVPKMIIEMLRP